MENIINWFEIPANDITRAISFYAHVLELDELEATEMMGTKMAFLPSDNRNVSGALVQGEDYIPGHQGALIYLNGGQDMQGPLSRVEAAGGKILLPKTQISPEMGYFALFTDTEGNRLAFHSIQ